MSQQHIDNLIGEVSKWEHISAGPHRFGGVEFTLIDRELGHIHRGGLLDIPFTKPIKEQLIQEGKAEAHHILPASGWISYRFRSEGDLAHALWLLRVSYVQKLGRILRQKGDKVGINSAFIQRFSANLPLSEALRTLVWTPVVDENADS